MVRDLNPCFYECSGLDILARNSPWPVSLSVPRTYSAGDLRKENRRQLNINKRGMPDNKES